MNTALKWLVLASILNLIGNSFGTIIAFQQNLAADWGGSLNGQDVLQDFLGFKGTALSAPLPFMLIQLMVTLLALRPGRSRSIGIAALTFVGLFYTLAQAGASRVQESIKASVPSGQHRVHPTLGRAPRPW